MKSPIDSWAVNMGMRRVLQTGKQSSEYTAVFCAMPHSPTKNRPIAHNIAQLSIGLLTAVKRRRAAEERQVNRQWEAEGKAVSAQVRLRGRGAAALEGEVQIPRLLGLVSPSSKHVLAGSCSSDYLQGDCSCRQRLTL